MKRAFLSFFFLAIARYVFFLLQFGVLTFTSCRLQLLHRSLLQWNCFRWKTEKSSCRSTRKLSTALAFLFVSLFLTSGSENLEISEHKILDYVTTTVRYPWGIFFISLCGCGSWYSWTFLFSPSTPFKSKYTCVLEEGSFWRYTSDLSFIHLCILTDGGKKKEMKGLLFGYLYIYIYL